MIRLAASLTTIASLSLPVLVYQDEYKKAEIRLNWRDHTYLARSLAERVACHAGCPPATASLRDDVEAFAATTADNPAQVQAARSMRTALDAGDVARVREVADLAVAEEDRLLPLRQEAAALRMRNVQDRATFIWAGGVLAAVVQAIQSWRDRRKAEAAARAEAAMRPEGGRS